MRGKQRCCWKKTVMLLLTFCLAVSLSGCGGDEARKNEVQKESTAGGSVDDATSQDDGMNSSSGEAEPDTDGQEIAEGEVEAGSAEKREGTGENKNEENASAQQQKVTKEMLVFRGKVTVDTLHFDQSVEAFKQMLNQADGFVETENFSDDGDLSDYLMVEEEEKHNLYTATVRVPSTQYDTMMNGTGNLGDVRTKSSNVQNVTQKYSTYQSQIKIYEAEYQRYLKLLEKASEDEYALQIEQKLFDLQVKIADLKSGITNLETDVAYSYIEITIKEVKEYQEKPVRTKTFLDRLKHACKTSWNVFLSLLEAILFCLIYTWYYIVILLILLFVVFKLRRKNGLMRNATEMKPREFREGVSGNNGQMQNESEVEPMESGKDESGTDGGM